MAGLNAWAQHPSILDWIIIDLLQKGNPYYSSRPVFLISQRSPPLPCLRASPTLPDPLPKAASIAWLGPFLNLSAQPPCLDPSDGASLRWQGAALFTAGGMAGVLFRLPTWTSLTAGPPPSPLTQGSRPELTRMQGTDQLSEESLGTTV